VADLTNFVYAEQANFDPSNGKSHIYAPLPIIVVKYLPTMYSFGVSFCISNINPDQTNNVEINFYDPSDNLLCPSSVTLPPYPENAEFDIPKELKAFTLSMMFNNVDIRVPGKYMTKISLNGVEEYLCPITIIKANAHE